MALSDPSCDGVANIWPSLGTAPVGMGIVVHAQEVLTCAHVVNLALGRDKRDAAPLPDDAKVLVKFPYCGAHVEIIASVVTWFPPVEQDRDCAILRLEEAIPNECGVAILADIDGHLLSDDKLSVFAATHANTPGVQIDAKFDRRVGLGWAQITSTTEGLSLVSGCSGAAVWDKDKQSVIGMAVAKVPKDEVPVAFSLPVSTLAGALKDLPHERKTISRKSHLTWLLVCIILFLFMLAHFLPTQGRSNPNILPWTKESRTLSAFFGLHFYVFLAPFPLWIWFRHVRSFKRHHWTARVPPFLNLNPYSANSNGPIGAGIGLLFLGILPAYAQGHFARIVFGNAKVGIRPSSFGLDPSDPSLTCFGTFCRHEDVGLWSILECSPFFNNVYQIGGPKLVHVVTYFPIIQPAILLAVTVICWGLLIAIILKTFKKHRTPR